MGDDILYVILHYDLGNMQRDRGLIKMKNVKHKNMKTYDANRKKKCNIFLQKEEADVEILIKKK